MSRTGNKPLLIYDARTASGPDPGQSPRTKSESWFLPLGRQQKAAEVKRQTPKQFGQLENSGMFRITAAA